MRDRIMKSMVHWYFRNRYAPEPLDEKQTGSLPSEHHLDSVPWISTSLTVCQSTALQMIAAHYGINQPRRYFDFLMGFTYGAAAHADFGFTTFGVDPETGLMIAAPYLGLVRRYFQSDDPATLLRSMRGWLAHGHPVRVPVDMAALYAWQEKVPHNEVLVGYDADGFFYYEPVCREPAPCQPASLPPGERGLYVPDERLLAAIASEAQLFGYPWRYAFVVFEPGPRQTDLGPVWKQNGEALVGGSSMGRRWGAPAIEHQAAELERVGPRLDSPNFRLALEMGAATRQDNATYLREAFDGQADLLRAAGCFDQAARSFQAALFLVPDVIAGTPRAGQIAGSLREAATAERTAGTIFLARAKAH